MPGSAARRGRGGPPRRSPGRPAPRPRRDAAGARHLANGCATTHLAALVHDRELHDRPDRMTTSSKITLSVTRAPRSTTTPGPSTLPRTSPATSHPGVLHAHPDLDELGVHEARQREVDQPVHAPERSAAWPAPWSARPSASPRPPARSRAPHLDAWRLLSAEPDGTAPGRASPRRGRCCRWGVLASRDGHHPHPGPLADRSIMGPRRPGSPTPAIDLIRSPSPAWSRSRPTGRASRGATTSTRSSPRSTRSRRRSRAPGGSLDGRRARWAAADARLDRVAGVVFVASEPGVPDEADSMSRSRAPTCRSPCGTSSTPR